MSSLTGVGDTGSEGTGWPVWRSSDQEEEQGPVGMTMQSKEEACPGGVASEHTRAPRKDGGQGRAGGGQRGVREGPEPEGPSPSSSGALGQLRGSQGWTVLALRLWEQTDPRHIGQSDG